MLLFENGGGLSAQFIFPSISFRQGAVFLAPARILINGRGVIIIRTLYLRGHTELIVADRIQILGRIPVQAVKADVAGTFAIR